VASACTNKGMPITKQAVHGWLLKGGLPNSEWLGTTTYAAVICEMIAAFGRGNVLPLTICPGAGQYMIQPAAQAA